ncbi:MAG: nitroreductase [Pseudomonadota bacterium]|nr:nitroreductase [Pseudomonadota bacterium]
MFNDRTSILSLLETRRSARPRDLVEPGPDPDQLRRILSIAARTPDHGKLHPWRFVHVARDRREALADLLRRAYLADKPDAGRLELDAGERFARQAPELVVALSTPTVPHKIPLWEQQLSCGAACMNLLHAANASGFSAGWVTGWAAYSQPVMEAFGCASEHDRIAGFIFIGTAGAGLEERLRPGYDEVAVEW